MVRVGTSRALFGGGAIQNNRIMWVSPTPQFPGVPGRRIAFRRPPTPSVLAGRVDLELAFEGVLQPAVYDSEGDVAAKVRENWQRSREVGMGVVEYVRTKGNFNNPELIRLLRSQTEPCGRKEVSHPPPIPPLGF